MCQPSSFTCTHCVTTTFSKQCTQIPCPTPASDCMHILLWTVRFLFPYTGIKLSQLLFKYCPLSTHLGVTNGKAAPVGVGFWCMHRKAKFFLWWIFREKSSIYHIMSAYWKGTYTIEKWLYDHTNLNRKLLMPNLLVTNVFLLLNSKGKCKVSSKHWAGRECLHAHGLMPLAVSSDHFCHSALHTFLCYICVSFDFNSLNKHLTPTPPLETAACASTIERAPSFQSCSVHCGQIHTEHLTCMRLF